MKRITTIIAAGAGTLALAGGIGAGRAYADPTPTTPTPTTSPTATANPSGKPADQARHRGGRWLARNVLHGEVTLAGPRHRVLDFQRGTIAAVSSSSITLTSSDGFQQSYVINSDSKVRRQGRPISVADLKPGDKAGVVALKDGSTLTARRIASPGA